MQENKQWVINCINSCTNLDQLKICETIISLFKFRLMKDGATEQGKEDLNIFLIEVGSLSPKVNPNFFHIL